MDYAKTFAISAAGMALERARVETAALNLAQAHTLSSPEGASFQPLRVVAHAQFPSQSFSSQVDSGLESQASFPLPEIRFEPTGAPLKAVHEPGHPFADAKGFIHYPGVDTATEMVTLMGALRAYEANVVAMNTAKVMALKTLEIGGGA